MQDLRTWSQEASAASQACSLGDMRYYRFMRDPPRVTRKNRRHFISPADGVIIHAGVVENAEAPIEVKGEGYSLRDLLAPMEPPDEPCTIVGIFMTFYDVHINRMPLGGALKWVEAEPIQSYNRPMLFVESDVLDDRMQEAYATEGAYVKVNARTVNRISTSEFCYYVVQIADLDIDVITRFAAKQGQWFGQGQRFSFVRWGSQVELIVPERIAQVIVPESVHVEAGVDPIMELALPD